MHLKQEKIITSFTEGSIFKKMIRFMLPFMASNALQIIYSIVDMIIVGQFVGSAGISAVSQGSALVLFAGMVGNGFAQSGQVVVAQLIGKNSREDLKKVIGTLFTMIFSISVVLTFVLLIPHKTYLHIISIPPEAFDMTCDYVLICGAGTLLTCGYNTIASLLRGMGDSKHPFLFILAASITNIVLDLLFTGVFQWRVAGAALATTISQGVSFALSIRLLVKNKESFYFDFKLASFKPDKKYLKTLLKLGFPLAIQMSIISVTMLIVNSFVNGLGVIASATFGIGLKLDDIINKISMAIEHASAPMIGQNLGAGNVKRVKQTVYWTWVICACMYVVFIAAYLLFGRAMFSMFTTDKEVLDLAPVFISAIMWSFPALAVMRGAMSFLHGTGNSFILMIFSFIDAALRAVLSYLFGIVFNMGFYGFVLGFGLAPLGVAVPGALYFFFAKWENKKLAVA